LKPSAPAGITPDTSVIKRTMGCFAVPFFFMPASMPKRNRNADDTVIVPDNSPWHSPPPSGGFVRQILSQVVFDIGILVSSLTGARRHVVRVIGRLLFNLRYLPAFAVTIGFVWLLLRFAGPPLLRWSLPWVTTLRSVLSSIMPGSWSA